MANEIEISLSISASKGGMNINRSENFKATMSGDSITHSVLEVGTSAEVLVESNELGSAGWCFLKNLDSSNLVEFGRQGADAADENLIKLKPGESCLFRVSDQGSDDQVYGLADTAACNVEYILIED